MRLVNLVTTTFECVLDGLFGGAQILDVKVALRIQHFAMAQRDCCAGGTFDPEPHPPGEILAHVGDLFDWALSLAKGTQTWHDSKPLAWDGETTRFFETLGRLDAYLASDAPLEESPERLFQGPVADALTHVGQLTMLRRVEGTPMRSENYHRADIVAGRVGSEQTAPRREF